ncbi:GNAT family N-acetyltransferase [Nocardia rhamnosiphila]
MKPRALDIAARLRLRPVQSCDEEAVRAAHRRMSELDGFDLALGLDPAMTWWQYLRKPDDRRRDLPTGIVPETFLLAVIDDEIVGRAAIRHTLNPRLSRRGGHIGYAVLQPHRRHGYGRAILHHSIPIARRLGIERILLTCDATNPASIRVIESCGGVHDRTRHAGDEREPAILRYWIR